MKPKYYREIRQVSNWDDRTGKTSITLIDLEKGEWKAHAGVNAFHEKAGRSQVNLVVLSLDKVFSPAE